VLRPKLAWETVDPIVMPIMSTLYEPGTRAVIAQLTQNTLGECLVYYGRDWKGVYSYAPGIPTNYNLKRAQAYVERALDMYFRHMLRELP
jgi:hypothetical protein